MNNALKHGDGNLTMIQDSDTQWHLAVDLRPWFDLESNVEITNELERRGALNKLVVEVDPEYSCSYFYTKTAVAAQDLIERLNAQPELRDVPGAIKPRELDGNLTEEVVVLSKGHWASLQQFLKNELTDDQWTELCELKLSVTYEEREA